MGLEPVFIAGRGENLGSFGNSRCLSGAPLGEVAGLMRCARLFVGNDSGPAHLAAAFGVPSVVIFGPSDSEIWSPWRTRSVVLKAEGPISNVQVDQVMRGIEEVLS